MSPMLIRASWLPRAEWRMGCAKVSGSKPVGPSRVVRDLVSRCHTAAAQRTRDTERTASLRQARRQPWLPYLGPLSRGLYWERARPKTCEKFGHRHGMKVVRRKGTVAHVFSPTQYIGLLGERCSQTAEGLPT